jgi:DNA-binding response OmpR family regulator
LAGERILVIEDNPERVEFLLTHVLSPHGYLAQTASCGQAGLSAAQEERPDLVLLDLSLKDVTSAEMLQQLQTCGDPPVILMTPRGAEAEALRAFGLGARAALIKPFTTEEVALSIARVLHQERLDRERDWLVRKLAAANEELERSLIEVQTLYDIGKTISSSLSLQDVLTAVVQAAVSITHAEEGYLLLPDPDSDGLYLRAEHNLSQDHVAGFRVQADDSIAGHVMRSGEPVILSGESDALVNTVAPVNTVASTEISKTDHLVRSLINKSSVYSA